MKTTELPPQLKDVDATRITDLDVRDDLRNGREPFGRIMEARGGLGADGILRLRAIFEPAPLYRVMAGHGLDHWTERLADDDWRIWFFPTEQSAPAAGTSSAPGGCGCGHVTSDTAPLPDGAVVLDVRGLEPPEPMERTLEAAEQLDEATTLVQINERVPRFLLPMLEERGFSYEVRQQSLNLVRTFIRRRSAVTASDGAGVLDVRIIPPREKHPTIFRTFDALEPGASFVLVNDHDPVPLRYQFEAERSGQFGWQYLEEGPELWRVEISRRDDAA